MPSIDRHAYLYGLQSKGLIDDWLPFNQATYIKDKLHVSIPTKSPQWEGVCSAMCFYILKRWMSDGVKGDALAGMDQVDVAEDIEDYMEQEGGDSVAYFQRRMQQDMYRAVGHSAHVGYKEVIETTTQHSSFCLLGWRNVTEDSGHAIICNAYPNFAIFDPNVGYLRAKNQSSYTFAFMNMITTFYPEYSGGNSGANISRFSRIGA